MTNKTDDGEINIGPINDLGLTPGINRVRGGHIQHFGERIVCGGHLVQESDLTLSRQLALLITRKINQRAFSLIAVSLWASGRTRSGSMLAYRD
ncbi:hypothetical protein [Serratia sp. M24T3]|uniref:hypothetical protein n=1 Tax=Serratia sp. M24T3 TaxID=932213 RepID=UPI00025B9EE3|nr:hypothetical protein [Serratia sp. M24T3]EIC86079.1 hypothetical protein SPM24T3_01738 [Serratia sp. M24T3]